MRLRFLSVIAVVVLAVMACASVASAQAVADVINPTRVAYTPSADHTQLTKYTLGFYLVGADEPVQVVDLPVAPPSLDPEDGLLKITQTMPFASLGFGVYVVKIKPWAGTIEGQWSGPSDNKGIRAPLPPASVAVKK